MQTPNGQKSLHRSSSARDAVYGIGIAVLIALLIGRMGRKSVFFDDRTVIFGREKIWARGHWYEGATVTRFELTTQSSTTGNTPKKTREGRVMIDPYVIRMWVNDSHATTVATNAWTMDVNHKIRDTLEKTWLAWKDQHSKKDEQEEFGDVSTETGMPDY